MIEEIVKGTQFARILGNFGEYLVCNRLTRSGFEVCIVDHTGMDVIAVRRQNLLDKLATELREDLVHLG